MSVRVLAWDPASASGTLVQSLPAGPAGTVVVAAQVGDVLLALRPADGAGPGTVASTLALPAPACVVATA